MTNRRLKLLQDRRAELLQQMQLKLDEAEDGVLGEEVQAEYDGLEKKLAGVKANIEREERLGAEEATANLDKNWEAATKIAVGLNAEEGEVAAAPENHEKPTPFRSLGEQLTAVVASTRDGYMDGRLRQIHAASGMSESVPADGGFMVQSDFSAELLAKAHDTSLLWSRCRNVPISATSNSVKINYIYETTRTVGNRWGGIRGYWLNEGADKTDSKPQIGQIELSLKKMAGLCYATDELLADAAALDAVLSQGFAEEFGFMLDDAVINGTGAGQPLGILNAACLVSVAKETGQAATTLVAENVEKMYARMWARSLGNAVWLINQDVWPQMFQFSHAVGAGGVPMFVPAGGLSAAPYGTLLGRPILPIEQCQTLGTKGDIYLADFGQYITATKGGVQRDSSIHVKFETDETTFRWVLRVDGQPWWPSALTPYKGSNTQSPFITLAVRS